MPTPARGYADVLMLSRTHALEARALRKALEATAAYRGTELLSLTDALDTLPAARQASWRAFVERTDLTDVLPDSFEQTVRQVSEFVVPFCAVMRSLTDGTHPREPGRRISSCVAGDRLRRYRAVMASSHEDDFHELSCLLFGAKERYRSVRATVRHFRRGDLATEAINRYVEYGFRHNILSNFDPPHDVPTYREYEDLDEVSRLWHERPDRWRQETDPSDGSGTVYRVVDGGGPWWFFKPPDWADCSPANRGEFSPDGELSGLLNPYELRHNELRYRILGTGTRTSGHGSTASIRTTVEAEAEAVSWDYAPLEPFENGADDYTLSVDAEVGVILRLASRLHGEEYDVFEVSDIAFDEEIPENTFRLQLTGVQFRRTPLK